VRRESDSGGALLLSARGDPSPRQKFVEPIVGPEIDQAGHRKQQESLIGLKLNRIGRIAELPGHASDWRYDRQSSASRAHHRSGDRARLKP
jgi:hypothetical protein